MEIPKLEHDKTYKYIRINQSNSINYTINKEKKKEKLFYREIRAILRVELNARIK